MDRRNFILALSAGAALLGAPPARAECGGPSALDFVEGLYEKQVRLQAQQTPLDQQEFLELFSKGMRALMRSPRRPSRNVSLGPLLNAFFGWGVLPGTEVATGISVSSPARTKDRRRSVFPSFIAARRTKCWSMSSSTRTAGASPTSSMTTARACSTIIVRWRGGEVS